MFLIIDSLQAQRNRQAASDRFYSLVALKVNASEKRKPPPVPDSCTEDNKAKKAKSTAGTAALSLKTQLLPLRAPGSNYGPAQLAAPSPGKPEQVTPNIPTTSTFPPSSIVLPKSVDSRTQEKRAPVIQVHPTAMGLCAQETGRPQVSIYSN